MKQHVQNYGGVKKYCWDPVNSIARARNVLRQCDGGLLDVVLRMVEGPGEDVLILS